jgi:pimeloyl-ACP methyl ester carboxylesterase
MKTLYAVLAAAALALGGANANAADAAKPPVSVVLVHGAFADGSSWNEVIPLLTAQGLNVIAVQNPLTSLADDVAFTKRAIANQPSKVVLVGHSWGGTVITQAGNDDKVGALVYVAAFAPSAGQSVEDTTKGRATPPGLASPVVDAAGFVSLSKETVAKHFAQDLSPKQTALIYATQGAIRGANFAEKVDAAAWQGRPSWYIVAEQDHMIDPALQKEFAAKIKATRVALPSSHVPMVSHPKVVAKAIIDAANGLK